MSDLPHDSGTRKVLDIDELARYLKINKRTIYKLIKDDQIPCSRIGGVLRFPSWVVDEWLEALARQQPEESEVVDKTERLKKEDNP